MLYDCLMLLPMLKEKKEMVILFNYQPLIYSKYILFF